MFLYRPFVLIFVCCVVAASRLAAAPVSDSDYQDYYDNNEDDGVAVDFVTVPTQTSNSYERSGRRQKFRQNQPTRTSDLFGILLNNPLTKLSQQLLETVGLNGRLAIDSSPGHGLTIDRELGAFGLNHRDRDSFHWTQVGPSFRKTQTLDAYGAELGQISTEQKFQKTPDGRVQFHGCNQGDLFGGIFSRCDTVNGLRSASHNSRFDPTGVSRFLKDTSELLSIINSRKRR